MATGYWPALKTLNQVAGELGLPQLSTLVGTTDVQAIQLLAMLNSAGNELLLYYPWEQFRREWLLTTTEGVGEYALPVDWSYALDQTQWDRGNHWPLIGPKSAQEWAWLKGGLLATAPRMRYRIYNNMFHLWPVPGVENTPETYRMAQEYVSKYWVISAGSTDASMDTDMIGSDGDLICYNPWLVIKYVKFKFYELKGFNTVGVQGDFMRVFNSLTGKDTGAPVLSLAPRGMSQYIGPWSVPDGSWNVGQP